MPLSIHFIDDEDERSGRAANHGGDLGIKRSDAIYRVRYKENDVGGLHRNEGPLSRAFRKIRVRLGSDTTRIHDLKWG